MYNGLADELLGISEHLHLPRERLNALHKLRLLIIDEDRHAFEMYDAGELSSEELSDFRFALAQMLQTQALNIAYDAGTMA
jgi:hypothetical protein